ncbi:MAG: DUF4178 domain-containing protein [Sandaracinus sp.]|nr:DUF4178 domain-containing protein [Sandaracinus sp.]
MGPRQAPCPNCGGPIELKLGVSHACVCPYCRFAVVRTDRDLQSIGKVSDLVPTAPELATGDRAYFEGDELCRGRAHSARPRPRALGRVLRRQLAHAVVGLARQSAGSLVPDRGGDDERPRAFVADAASRRARPFLPGIPGMWSVSEQGQSRTLSAEGELPYPVRGGEQGWYVDLEGPNGAFATIDYGDGQQAPSVFVGKVLSPEQLRLERANPQRPIEKVDTSRLRCPSCGAPVPLLVPDRAERAGCGHCGALLDYDKGAFRVLAAMEKARSRALIPLGKEGTLLGEQVVCLAFMERATWVDGMEFRWREYLLYSEAKGYRWLMEDNGHWTWMEPVSSGELGRDGGGVSCQGRRHRLFSQQNVSVVGVVGELYWKVEAGETTYTSDYIAPPFMLSEERSSSEVNWSVGRYVEPEEIQKAFGLEGAMPPRVGVGFCQPNPHSLKFAGAVAGLLMPLLCVLFMFFEVVGQHPHVASLDVTMPPVPGPYEAAPAGAQHALHRRSRADHAACRSADERAEPIRRRRRRAREPDQRRDAALLRRYRLLHRLRRRALERGLAEHAGLRRPRHAGPLRARARTTLGDPSAAGRADDADAAERDAERLLPRTKPGLVLRRVLVVAPAFRVDRDAAWAVRSEAQRELEPLMGSVGARTESSC